MKGYKMYFVVERQEQEEFVIFASNSEAKADKVAAQTKRAYKRHDYDVVEVDTTYKGTDICVLTSMQYGEPMVVEMAGTRSACEKKGAQLKKDGAEINIDTIKVNYDYTKGKAV